MLRLRRKLEPRISNYLAAVGAMLLLVSSLPGISDLFFAPYASPILPTASRTAAVDPGQEVLPAAQAATRQRIKISLMIFH